MRQGLEQNLNPSQVMIGGVSSSVIGINSSQAGSSITTLHDLQTHIRLNFYVNEVRFQRWNTFRILSFPSEMPFFDAFQDCSFVAVDVAVVTPCVGDTFIGYRFITESTVVHYLLHSIG